MKKSPDAARASRQNFEPRLRAYSTLSAATLATAAALGAAATASAQIHDITSLTNTGGNFGTTLILASNSAGLHAVNFGFAIGTEIIKFAFTGAHFSGPSRRYFIGGETGGGGRIGNGGLERNLGKPADIAPGGAIQGAQFGFGGPFFYTANRFPFPYQKGNFVPPVGGQVTGYLGFKENIVNTHFTHTNHYYGWFRVQVTADNNGRPHSIALDPINGVYGAYALQDGVPGGITAGATAIPEPANVASGLGLLALGAAGVREMRRRRAVAA